MAYFHAVNFSDFMKEKEKKRERIASRLFERIAFSVRAFGTVTFTSNAILPMLYSHIAFALDTAGGIVRSSKGRVVIRDKKDSRGERKRGRETESKRETQTILS